MNRLAKRYMSDEHFTVDGTLIQAWTSQKSFRKKDGSDDGDGTNSQGQERSNQTYQSITDSEARHYKKSYGKESKLAYLGHAQLENRNGLIAAAMATQADGHAERDAALLMLDQRQKDSSRRITVGADKAYNAEGLHRRNPRLQRYRACVEERKGTPLEPRSKNHPARRLCDQPQPPLVDRKDLRLAQADRPTCSGKAARSGEGRLALRLQLRRPQPAPAAIASPTNANWTCRSTESNPFQLAKRLVFDQYRRGQVGAGWQCRCSAG